MKSKEIILFSVNNKASKVQQVFNTLLNNKILSRIEAKKAEIGTNLLRSPNNEKL